jgi:Zn-dependent protease
MLLNFIRGGISPFEFIIFVVAVLMAITVHEFAHALRAHQAGDPTPGSQGRLTLNPLAHYDPIGTTLILAMGLGWGRAVLTQPATFRHPRRDSLMISLWGPLSNILLAVGTLLIFRFVPALKEWGPWTPLVGEIVQWNLVLAFFNLIPLPPLDGSKVLSNLLPIKQAANYERFVGQYGFLVLLLLVFAGSDLIDKWIGYPTVLIIRTVMWGAPNF